MPKTKTDYSDPHYLDQLGRESARECATNIKINAERFNVELPLDDFHVNTFLEDTIVALDSARRLNWKSLSNERQSVFIQSWASEMTRLGIRQ